jgi:uncharacterized cupredoxin-like copper-binding protein
MRKLTVAFLALLALTGAACGGTAKNKVAIPVYTITASEPSAGKFSFDIPQSMKGGVITLRLTNNGKDPHDFQLAKVVAGHTLDDVTKQVASEDAPLEPWLEAAGGVGTTAPGKTNEVTLNLTPGKYWYFCTESSEVGGSSVSHATNGMAGEMTLSGESGAALPSAGASIVASEYTFTATGLKAGANTVSFRNSGRQLHHAIIVPITAGKTLEDVKAALASDEEQGPPPVDFDKAIVAPVINPGQVVVFSAELTAGTKYAVLCFMPDKGTAGPPHAAKGMLVEVSIA